MKPSLSTPDVPIAFIIMYYLASESSHFVLVFNLIVRLLLYTLLLLPASNFQNQYSLRWSMRMFIECKDKKCITRN